MKIVIRAGGSGTRLWPMSRRENPKQFQAVVGDRSMIRNTINRIKPSLKDSGDLFISVSERLTGKIRKEIPELRKKNLIIEPDGRNTGPAICLESCFLARRFGEDTIVASLPSDDYISDAAAFRKMLGAAENFLKNNPDYIVTPAAKPVCPDTGYSYIKTGGKLGGEGKTKIFKAAGWAEKPSAARCKKMIKSEKIFSHTGMYVWKLKTILDLFRKFHPDMYKVCCRVAEGRDEKKYAKLKKMTVESAVTAQASKIAVAVSKDFIWSDLGKWYTIKDILLPGKKNIIRGTALAVDTDDCLIHGPKDKLIAAVGLTGIAIVLTDDALLVCPKERSGEVKNIVERLGKKGFKKFI